MRLVRAHDLIGVDPAARPVQRSIEAPIPAWQVYGIGRADLDQRQHHNNHPDAHLALSIGNEEADVNHRGQNNRHGHAEQNPHQNGHFQPPLVWVESATSCPTGKGPHFAGLLPVQSKSSPSPIAL